MALKLEPGHQERFQVEDLRIALLKPEGSKPRRFKAVAYSGADVGRFWGRMVIKSAGISRSEKTAMLFEHNDSMPVAVCESMDVDEKTGKVTLEGYFLSDKATGGESSKLIAAADEGLPFKMSVGVRLLKHHEIEEGASEEVNGRTFSGPMTVVDEAHLFETSFIVCNPADLNTEAAIMRASAQERLMAETAGNTEVKTTQLSSVTTEVLLTAQKRDELLAEGERRAMAALTAAAEIKKAIRLAIPGKSEKAKAARLKARQDNLTLEQVKDLGAARMRAKLVRLEKRERDRAEAVKKLESQFSHTGIGFVPPEDRGETGRFEGMKIEDRIHAELRARPALVQIFKSTGDGYDAEAVIKAWLKTKDRLSSRDGKPVLCDLLGGRQEAVSPATLATLKKMAEDVLTGLEAQRLTMGATGPDLARVTVNGFQGAFYNGYEEELSKNWFADLSFQIPSDQQAEIVRWLSAPPMLQEWKGPRIAKGLQIYEQLLQAIKFEGTLDVDRFQWDHQKFELIARSFGLFGAVASQHWDIKGTQLLESNPTAYDRVAFFAATHTLGGDSGTIINDYTSTGTAGAAGVASKLAVNDPSMPTQLEWANILLQLTPKFRAWAWANGIKMNGTARSWGVMVHPDFEGNLQAAISSERLDLGASNPLFGQRSQYKVIPNAYIGQTDATKKKYGYIFRLDTANKPFLRAEPDPLEMQWQGPGSHMAYLEDKYSMGLRAVRAIAPGAFESALRFTIGAA